MFKKVDYSDYSIYITSNKQACCEGLRLDVFERYKVYTILTREELDIEKIRKIFECLFRAYQCSAFNNTSAGMVVKDLNNTFRRHFNLTGNIIQLIESASDKGYNTLNLDLTSLKKDIDLDYFLGYLRIKGNMI